MGRASTCDGTLTNLGNGLFKIASGDGYLPNTTLAFINGMAQCDYTEVDPETGCIQFGPEVVAEMAKCNSSDDYDLIYDNPNALITDILDAPISASIGEHRSLSASLGYQHSIQATIRAPRVKAELKETCKLSATIANHRSLQGEITC